MTFRFRAVIVLPQMANVPSRKLVIAQLTNPIDMETVLPLRTAPSQMIASYARYCGIVHQESVSRCLGEKGFSFVSILLCTGTCERRQQILCCLLSCCRICIFIHAFQGTLPIEEVQFHTAVFVPLYSRQIEQIHLPQLLRRSLLSAEQQGNGICAAAECQPC